jgi:hypothetical protein
LRQISNHLVRSNTLASTPCDKQEMARDSATPVAEAEKPIVIPMTEEIDPETGCPDVKPPPEGYKRCPVCKTDKLTQQNGNLDTVVDDKYKQIDTKKLRRPTETHPDFRHCLPPTKVEYGKNNDLFSVFTAGSIEMGSAIQWQKTMVEHLKDLPIIITNPRRGHWNPNINAKKDDKDFFDQVKWELDSLTRADVIVFFFDCNTSSPVTLLELGLWAKSGKVIVCCDQRYWRQSNVDIVCERYRVPLVSSFHHLIPALREFMRLKGLEEDPVTRTYPKFPKDKADAELKELENSIEQNKVNKGNFDKQWWAKYQDTEEEIKLKMTKAEKEKKEAKRKADQIEVVRRGKLSDAQRDAEDAAKKEERRKDAEEALKEGEVS